MGILGKAAGKIRSMLLSKPVTARWKGVRTYMHRLPRDLPPFNFHVIRRMLGDPTIRLGLAFRMAPLYSAQFAFKDNDEWHEGVRASSPDVSEFVLKQLRRIWRHELEKILTAQIWGWSAGEITYRLNRKNLVEVDQFLIRSAYDVRAMTEMGEVKGVEFFHVPGAHDGNPELRMPKAWWFAHEPEDENAYGISALEGAYDPWSDKHSEHGA